MNKKTYNAPKCKLIELEKEILQAVSNSPDRNGAPSSAPARAGRNSTQTFSLDDEEEEW